ncbi:hypothetical protein BCR33DRAFT_738575 [Rhizoclosmatium globosum]|uniref:Nitroreductase domain-containing protein n=1 Tax=Rhizoclosmatium globosum TaxID=329046 RepID=A0A1Y2C8J4_9FUNG|nr:hypothetical protein BCR33DRAFT_738575 [Rhizoclosmatium globosum]|eukprot:ORY43266.1 hypothetical protein BCR33DRAFT_738575 [Rhizoclosmatium globosum]
MGAITDFVERVISGDDIALSATVAALVFAALYIATIQGQAASTRTKAKAKITSKPSKPTSLPKTLSNRDLDNTPFLEVAEIAEAEEADFHDPFDLPHVPFKFDRISHKEAIKRSEDFYNLVNQRRSLRMFSEDPVPIEVVRNCCMAAATAPSGAHTEPWTFAIIHTREMKAEVRQIIEHEEKINYESRMSKQWVNDLAKLKTNWEKEYLETAPYLIVVFKQTYGIDKNGKRTNNYYYEQSNSIACGILITAIHNAGLVTLTSTPMNAGPAIRGLLGRPANEKVQLLLPVGYPAKDATVPDLKRKSAKEVIFEEAAKTGSAIVQILGSALDNRDKPIPPPEPKQQKPKGPIKLPTYAAREILKSAETAKRRSEGVEKPDIQLSLSISSDLMSERQSNISLKSAATHSLKQLQKLKSSRNSVNRIAGRSQVNPNIPKISRLYPDHSEPQTHDATHKSSIHPKNDINQSTDLYSYADLMNSTDLMKTYDPQDSFHYSTTKSRLGTGKSSKRSPVPSGKREHSPTRITMEAKDLLKHPNMFYAGAGKHVVAAGTIGVQGVEDGFEVEDGDGDVGVGVSRQGVLRRPVSSGFSHASTGRLVSRSKSRSPGRSAGGGGHSRSVDADMALFCQKLESDPRGPAVYSAGKVRQVSTHSVRQQMSKQSSMMTASAAESQAGNTTDKDSSWFGDDDQNDVESEEPVQDFVIREEDEDEFEEENEEYEEQEETGELEGYTPNVNIIVDDADAEPEPEPEPEPEMFKTMEDVDDIMRKYDLIWRHRAKRLRGAPATPPSMVPSIANLVEHKELKEEIEADIVELPEPLGKVTVTTFTSSPDPFISSADSSESISTNAKRKSSGASKRSGKSSGSSRTPRSTVSFREDSIKDSRPATASGSGTGTGEGSRVSSGYKRSSIAMEDIPVQPQLEIENLDDAMETSSTDSSDNFSRHSMVITSLNHLAENKRRKSLYESNQSNRAGSRSRRPTMNPSATDIQIPVPTSTNDTMEGDDVADDQEMEGAEAETNEADVPFPQFAQMNVPNVYAHSFTRPPSENPPRSTKLTQVPMLGGPTPVVLEDWYLDDNAFSKESKNKATWDQIVEDRGPPVLIVPPKPPIPGLKPHPSHHHTHFPEYLEDQHQKDLAFNCNPQSPPRFTEVVAAENSLKASNRPRYAAPATIFGSSFLKPEEKSDLKDTLKLDATEVEDSDSPTVSLQIKGKSVHIVPLEIGAASVGLGLSWSPAPPKMSLPLKVYQHQHSVPETPRTLSRQSKRLVETPIDLVRGRPTVVKEEEEKATVPDEELNYSDMLATEDVPSVTKPIRLRSKTPLVGVPIEESTLESMLVNEEEWVKTDSVVIPEVTMEPSDESNLEVPLSFPEKLGSPGNAIITDVIEEEETVEPAEAGVIANQQEVISASVVQPAAVPEVEALPTKPENTSAKTEEGPNSEPPLPKKIRHSLSDTEASTKKGESTTVGRKRVQSHQPVTKLRKKVPVLPPLPKKKAKKVSRIVSTSSSGSAESTTQPLADMGSTMSLQGKNYSRASSAGFTSEDPIAFYKKRRMSQTNQSVATILSYNSLDRTESSYDMSLRSMNASTFSIAGKRDTPHHKEKTLYTEPVGPDWYELIHNNEKREKLFSPAERAKYPTLTDPGPPEELASLEGDVCMDPISEIDKLTSLILSSNLPIPAFLRRRGILFGRVGSLVDPFHSDALWQRHQLYLRLGDTDRALKDLDAITDTNKGHYGAFLAKARIYEELTAEERSSGLPLEPATLALIKMAIVNFSQLIRLKPDDAEGYYHRACLFEAENEMVYANEDFRMVRQLDPANEHAIHNLAVYSFQRQLWEDGIMAFTKLIKLNPENGQAYLYRGRANAYLAKWDEALRDLTLAIQLAPDRADVFFFRGCLLRERNKRKAIEDLSVTMLYYKLKKYELAIIDYTTVVELDQTKATAWLNLGILYMRFFNDYFRALDCFDKAIFHDPIQIKAFLCRGDLLQILDTEFNDEFAQMAGTKKKSKANGESALSYLDRAIRDYSKAMHLCPSDYLLYLYRGRLLLKQGKMKDATYDFYAAFELNPGIAQTFMQRALVLSFQRKYQQIINEFNEKVKRERIEDPSLYVLVAKARIKVGDNEGAIKDLAKALEFSRIKDPQIYLQKGICFENIKDYTNASAEFTKCISLEPSFAKAYYHRGVCKLHEGNPKGAADLDMAIKLDPKFFDAYLSRGSYNQSKGNYAEGIEDCNAALKLEPTSIRAHLLRGACNCKLHQYGMAIVDFSKAIHLDKACNAAFYNRAVTYQLLEDYKNAIKDYSIVLLLVDDSQGDAENALLDLYAARDNFPGDARLHGLLALCLQKVGRTDESLEAFTSSIRVNKTLIEAYLGRGNVYSSIGQCKAAKRDYSRVIHMYPTCTEAYVNLAYTLQMEGRYQKSWDFFTMAIAINPSCTSALEGRSVVNHTMRNYFGALMDITKAIEITPNSAELHTNRAVIYSSMNDRVKALSDNKLAIKIDPQYALAYFNTANLYFAQSRWEIALDYYNKALELEPKDEAAILNRGITRAQLNAILPYKDYSGALDDLNTATILNPQCVEVYFNRAQLFQKLKRYEEADADYSMVLKLSPYDDSAYKQRGDVRGKQGKVFDSMVDYARDIINVV